MFNNTKNVMNNNGGFSVVTGLLSVFVVAVVGFAGWYVWQNNKEDMILDNYAECVAQNGALIQESYPEVCVYKDQRLVNPDQKIKAKEESNNATKSDDKYLVIKEWSIKFEKPESIEDIEYQIIDNTVGFYAKPVGYDVEYRNDYKNIDERGLPAHAHSHLVRSTESTKDKAGDSVKGKKIGDFYYYTSHSFSGLATGKGDNGIFLDEHCEGNNYLEPKCKTMLDAEYVAFESVNKMLETIEQI